MAYSLFQRERDYQFFLSLGEMGGGEGQENPT